MDYPWRRTHDPYEVLVSEIMLQQTQIATVLGKGYYQRFLTAFPDVQSLAEADDDRLLKAWEGLGYYRRARMLRETARAVVGKHGGNFPSDLESLLELPGIGRYTAGALRAFAFQEPSVLVDGNVSRVLSRLMDYGDEIDTTSGQNQMWEWAGEFADNRHPMAYHSALMELGQRICRPKKPDCQVCPVATFCGCSQPENLPRKKTKTKLTEVHEHAVWVMDGQGRVLMHREYGKRRTGLWKLPVRDFKELSDKTVVAKLTYGITRYRVRLQVHSLEAVQLQEGDEWVQMSDLDELALAAPFRKVLKALCP